MSRGLVFCRARFGRRCGMRSTRTHPTAPARHPRRLGADRQRRALGALTGSSLIHPARRVVPAGAGRRRCTSHPSRSSPTTCSGATTSTDRGCRSPCRPTKRWCGSATTRPAPRPTFGRSGTARCLHADWRDRGQVAIDIQWGKHGSLPHGTIESDLPGSRKLNLFYAFTWIGLPDIWLGDLTRRGPWCFCHGYSRYRDYSRLLPLADRVDVVVRAENATDALVAVFGRPYSKKRPWPPASESALTDSLPETRKPPGL